ncbi:MAG: cytidine deaminase [Sphaerochaetaceae bacterium]|nr:cytidine deaminase [Sphaerochaetaceae bacterium]
MEKFKTDIERKLFLAAREVRLNSYSPYSNFKVGAALLSHKSGKIYTGTNVENSSYGATICAERSAVVKAISEEGNIEIETLFVVSDANPPSPPCAMCLQVLSQFCKSDTPILLSNLEGDVKRFTFGELLPHPFVL